jgi:hypothetical protein
LLHLRQIHYASGDSHFLEEELRAKGIGFEQALLTEEFLQELKHKKVEEHVNK